MRKVVKIILPIIMLLCLINNVKAESLNITKPQVTNHEKIKVYIFRGDGCPHCEDFLNYFNVNIHEYTDYFEIVAFESWKDAANVKLRKKINDLFSIEEKRETTVPLIIVGNWHTFGFSDTLGETIINKALEEYQNDNYEDVVSNLITDQELESTPETLQEACEKENIKVIQSEEEIIETEKAKNNKNGMFLVIVFGALVGIVGLIVFIAKK